MTTALSLTTVDDCWNRIGFCGDRSCPELAHVVHCHNCQVFSNAGRPVRRNLTVAQADSVRG